jgi:myo-inositol-1(or 4)-monophosphatase
MKNDYEQICIRVQEVARNAGDFIREERKKITASDVETKSTASFVTYVDKAAERIIVDALQKILPEAGFETEEGTAGNRGENLTWVVDPLDGTTNFIHGIYPNSVSIGLLESGIPVLGVVYETGLDELFYAWKGSAAYLNGEVIHTGSAVRSEETLIGTGFPYYDFVRMDDYFEVLRYLMKNTRGLRRLGSAAADLCYVAAGRFDAFFEHALHSWDVAAGAFILQQAGGKVTDFEGGDNWLHGGEILAASNSYFPEFFSILNQRLGKR